MSQRPSMVHPCSPPAAREITLLGYGVGDTWSCPVCGDLWKLTRGVSKEALLPRPMQKPEWTRLNLPD